MGARYLPQLLVPVALAIGAMLMCWSPILLDDQWWHMLTGRYLIEVGSVPTTDPFSFTAQGEPWVNWEWLSGLVMVISFDLLGAHGLVLLRFAALMATVALLCTHLVDVEATRSAVALPVRLFGVSLALLVTYGRVADRPHLYALPFLTACLLLSTRAAARQSLRPMVVLLGLMVPWVLIHPSWPLGIALHAAIMADRWLEPTAPRSRRTPTLRFLYWASPFVLMAPALVLHDLGVYADAVTSLFATSSLREWQPLWTYLHWTNTPLVAFLVLSVGWLGTLMITPARLRRPSTWLALGVWLASWWFVRFTPLFAIIALPQIHAVLSGRWAAWSVPVRTANLAAILVASLLQLVVVATKAAFLSPFVSEVDRRTTPVAIGAFMEHYGMGGNVLCNEMNAHAYLAFRRYPNVREFIDGRVPQLFPEAAWIAYVDAMSSPALFEQLLDNTDTNQVVLQHLFAPKTAELSALLWQRHDFELVHFDEDAMLWTRVDVLAELDHRPKSYRFVVPPLIDDAWFAAALSTQAFPSVLAELEQLLAAQPESSLAATLADTLAEHPAATPTQKSALQALRH